MKILGSIIFGALTLMAIAMLTTVPASAFGRDHGIEIVTSISDHGPPGFDLVLTAAALSEQSAIDRRAAEAPVIDEIAVAPHLGPEYALSLETNALSLVEYHRRC